MAAGIAALSACLLMTEVTLTRILSVTLWYHFAFLAVSVALFGTGVGALWLYLRQDRLDPGRADDQLALAALVMGVAIAGCAAALPHVAPDLPAVLVPGTPAGAPGGLTLGLLAAFAIAAAPFFAGGFALGLAVMRYASRVHSIYFGDLFGAGLGCLVVIPVLEAFGAPTALVVIGGCAAASGLIFVASAADRPRGRIRATLACAAVVLWVLAASNPVTGFLDLRTAKGVDFATAGLEFERWNSFSQVVVLDRPGLPAWGLGTAGLPERLPSKLLVIDMGAATPVMGFDGDLEKARTLLWDATSFAYRLRPAARAVCVIGAGGGRDVLAALASGARHVTAVEINPLIVEDVMRDRYRAYSGGLYDRPDVAAVVDDGRAFLRRSTERYDVIQLSMVDTSAATAAGAYALTENTLYTVEAFGEFLDRLAPGGILSVATVTLPDLAGGARLAALARAAVRARGGDPSRQIAAIATSWQGRSDAALHNILVRRERFTAAEAEALAADAVRLGFRAPHVPGWGSVGGPRPDALVPDSERWIARILASGTEGDFQALLASLPLDVSAPTDDRPFFFYQNRLVDLGRAVAALRPSYMFGNGLFVLAKAALVSLVMTAAFLIAPLVLRRRVRTGGREAGGAERRHGMITDAGYVICLGLGFLFVEIGMIQRFTVYLGRPTYTLAVVLMALLCGGGTGSRLFGLWSERRAGPAPVFPVFAAVLLVLAAFWQSGLGDGLLDVTAAWSPAARGAIAATLLAPLGVLLGVPFPAGLAAVARRARERLPWLWCLNSAASVLGSVLATIVAMHAGISWALWAAAALYAVAAALLAPVMRSRVSRGPLGTSRRG